MKDRITPIAVIFTIVLLCAYVGSYVSLVEVGKMSWASINPNDMTAIYAAEYRVGGRTAEIGYWPAYRVDVWLRSSLWKADLSDSFGPPILPDIRGVDEPDFGYLEFEEGRTIALPPGDLDDGRMIFTTGPEGE